ncbi:MAG: metal-dependent hydrolase [Gemmatimonadaceae bacterium]
MDNLTHTLVGAALSEAGLKRRTPLAAATLMIGANFPDLDVLGLFFPNSLDIRRGTTHGFLALAILPFVLAWLVALYDRRVRRWRQPSAPPADPRQLLILSTVAIWSHPALDFMNIYGMRWLMPFVNQWFYADALFIVDLWMFLALLGAVLLSRRMTSVRPARAALGAVSVYIVAMLCITGVGRQAVGAAQTSRHFMVGPTPITPWQREIIVDEPEGYRFGTWTLFGEVAMASTVMLKGDTLDPAILAARRSPEAAAFLKWSRFPFYRVEREGLRTLVRIADARYVGNSGLGWASVEVRLP